MSFSAIAQTDFVDTGTDCQLASDSLSLVALYNSTDGANWTYTWDLSQPVSTWYGIILSEDGCNVACIDLDSSVDCRYVITHGNNLVGTIPKELGNLTKLNVLSLFSNSLVGEIPIELGNLINLNILYLGRNSLVGEIPIELGNLTNLNILALGSNNLVGEIPIELGNLTDLNILDLDNNSLVGEIPKELGNLMYRPPINRTKLVKKFVIFFDYICTARVLKVTH